MVAGIDSNIVIILTADVTANAAAIRARTGDFELLVASTIAVTESLVVPFRSGNADDLAAVRRFLFSPHVRIVTVDSLVAEEAARLRASFNLKLADSIHLATAINAGASSFLTTDKHFDRCVGKLPIDIIRTDP